MPDVGEDAVFDAVGVGIGPSNLSAAALLQPVTGLRAAFFERNPEFQWFPGMLFPEATIQVSHLKDLVTLVDPTSPHSFLAFLAARGRLYRFANARFPKVTRREFNQYFRWVCSRLDSVAFGAEVRLIEFDGDHFVFDLPTGKVRARNAILGTGLAPRLPSCARSHLGRTVFHAARYLHQNLSPAGRRVAVIGGGQSAAEIVWDLLQRRDDLPEQVLWISRRPNFLPIDDSPFTNELFTPSYSDFFFRLPRRERTRLLEEQKLASDGIDLPLLERIYQRLYELELIEGRTNVSLLAPGWELTRLTPHHGGWELEARSTLGADPMRWRGDVVILATGFEYRIPACLEGLVGRLSHDRHTLAVGRDFSVEWDGPPARKLYVQNAARSTRGVADPNLSLTAWRSAIIINSLAGRPIYPVPSESAAVDWGHGNDQGRDRDALPKARRAGGRAPREA